ncbi:MAG TPA: hypothetical protein DEF27_09715, partial [Oscillatoriales bacterium UBA8482]|nr:hypothetical protein [Oscillatoriales bacterium UBA8482]
ELRMGNRRSLHPGAPPTPGASLPLFPHPPVGDVKLLGRVILKNIPPSDNVGESSQERLDSST